jgi:hypothetical protein
MTGVQLLPDYGVISVRLSGAVQVQQRVDAFDALRDLHVRTRCRKVLIDLRDAVLVDGSHAETLDHAARLARSSVMKGLRIAYIGDGIGDQRRIAGGAVRVLLPALQLARVGVALAVSGDATRV